MLRNIFSYLWKSTNIAENELSLEGACNILKEQLVEDKVSTSQLDSVSVSNNSYSLKIGSITKCNGSSYVIDDLYTFRSENKTFAIGSKVSYNYFTCDNKENILNVNLVESDWESLTNFDTFWNTRIIICKVAERINRNLVLSPGNITIDLDNVSLDFLPMVGDWLELDIKCSINENSIDLSGQIIEINKISPVRAHIEEGVITNWDISNLDGIVNKNVYFNKHTLSHGYIPLVGDKVIVEMIESDQQRCSWRALKVIPESITKCKINSVKSEVKSESTIVPEIQDPPGLCIELPHLSFTRLNQKYTFFVTVSNTSESNFVLQIVKFPNNNSQCKILDNIKSPKVLSKGMSYKISCMCTARYIGITNELIHLVFENCTISKWIGVNVTIDCNRESITKFERRPKFLNDCSSQNQLMKGQRVCMPPRFIAAQIPHYIMPKKLLDTVNKYASNEELMLREELKVVNPSLFSNLTCTNYEDKFHSLLYLDEISNLIMIRNYDQEKACFIVNDEFLMLEIENLSERRPSIILGDKIIATDPLSKCGLDFEGFVHKVGAKHIYIKFSQIFHDKYKGEDYSIKIVPSRTSYRRLHHAVYLAARNLGKEILFPTRVYENKEPQVSFILSENNSGLENTPNKKKLNPVNILNKLIEINKSSNLIDMNVSNITDACIGKEECSDLKLEWYNNNLNSKQKDAVINVLLGIAKPLPYIIFGPPGTGKTVTIIEIVLQIIRLIPHSRLLITAPSNSASDLIALRLIKSGVLKPGDLVRLVSHNYALSDLIPITLVPYCATGSIAKEGTVDHNIPQQNGIQFECSRTSLGRHRITVATCSAAGQLYSMAFPKGHFSHIIVDEAAQASEPDVLIPLAFLDRTSGQVVLAGDPMQLGPVVLSKLAGDCGFDESYLERLCCTFPYSKDPEGFKHNGGYDPRLLTKLLYNYRSVPTILKLSSFLFYDDELIPTVDENNEEVTLCHKLKDILPRTNENKAASVVFHGVNGVNFQNADSPSWYNPHEAAQVFYYINELYRMGITSKQIGVITPYIKQVKEIRSLLVEAEFDIPKIGTVEEFQGQEFDVIVLSTVRSCEEFIRNDISHSLGFVSSPRRLNVAISRSKALLIIIGNPRLLCHDAYWRSVIKYCFENGAYVGCNFSLA